MEAAEALRVEVSFRWIGIVDMWLGGTYALLFGFPFGFTLELLL